MRTEVELTYFVWRVIIKRQAFVLHTTSECKSAPRQIGDRSDVSSVVNTPCRNRRKRHRNRCIVHRSTYHDPVKGMVRKTYIAPRKDFQVGDFRLSNGSVRDDCGVSRSRHNHFVAVMHVSFEGEVERDLGKHCEIRNALAGFRRNSNLSRK